MAPFDPSTARSRSGFILFYAGCLLFWFSKLQTEFAISTTEAEYISLSQSLREVIYLMDLFTELKSQGVPIVMDTPNYKSTAFTENTPNKSFHHGSKEPDNDSYSHNKKWSKVCNIKK